MTNHYGTMLEQGLTPPPFRRPLPGGTGYITDLGRIIYYGKEKSLAELQAGHTARMNQILSKGWPEGRKDPVVERIDQVLGIPANRPNNLVDRKWCAACKKVPDMITDHHLVPKQVANQEKYRLDFKAVHTSLHKTIQLCGECHAVIHQKLSNRQLGLMSEAEQLNYIRSHNQALVEKGQEAQRAQEEFQEQRWKHWSSK